MTFPPDASGSVLVVDDDFDIREALGGILEDMGFAVQTAADGMEALELLRARAHPGLILLDLMMPRMNGYQFRAIQARDPLLSPIPVVVFTADGRIDRHAADLAALTCLRKPIDVDELVAAVRRHCAGPAARADA